MRELKKHLKKILLIGFISLILFTISSCVPATNPPIGVWKNENLNIMLYVKPEYRNRIRTYHTYPGISWTSDDVEKILVEFGNGPRLSIFEASLEGYGREVLGEWWIAGNFRQRTSDEFRLNLGTDSREKVGYRTIVFHRQEEYDPINPEDWFPSIP